VAQMEQT